MPSLGGTFWFNAVPVPELPKAALFPKLPVVDVFTWPKRELGVEVPAVEPNPVVGFAPKPPNVDVLLLLLVVPKPPVAVLEPKPVPVPEPKPVLVLLDVLPNSPPPVPVLLAPNVLLFPKSEAPVLDMLDPKPPVQTMLVLMP